MREKNYSKRCVRPLYSSCAHGPAKPRVYARDVTSGDGGGGGARGSAAVSQWCRARRIVRDDTLFRRMFTGRKKAHWEDASRSRCENVR